MNAKEAVRKGTLVVNGPVILIILIGAALAGYLFRKSQHNPAFVAAGFAGLVLAIALAWLYWSIALPRWREWALRAGADPEETQRLAMNAGITWPKGSVFEKTELPPRDRNAKESPEGE